MTAEDGGDRGLFEPSENRSDPAGRTDGRPESPLEPPERDVVLTGATSSEIAAQPRPRAIAVSYRLWLGACLLAVTAAGLTLLSFDQLHAEMLSTVEQQFPNEPVGTREEVATAAVAVLIGTGVLVALIQLLLAVALGTGRGWARPLLVVVAALGALYGVAVFEAVPVAARAGLYAVGALVILAVVLMFTPGAGSWFRQQRLARSGGYGDES